MDEEKGNALEPMNSRTTGDEAANPVTSSLWSTSLALSCYYVPRRYQLAFLGLTLILISVYVISSSQKQTWKLRLRWPPPPPVTACGDYPSPLSTTQPNVLIIGDSISMPVPYSPGGYGAPVHQALKYLSINVWHSGGWKKGGQASNTIKGLKCTNPSTPGNWLNFTGTYDIIHFNFGLHDLVAASENSEHVDITQYGLNLAEIYARLAPRAKHVIWTTTTPCPSIPGFSSKGRTEENVRLYNTEALQSLQAAASAVGKPLLVDDLYAAVNSYCGVNYTQCDLQQPHNVHFEPKGNDYMGIHVVANIIKALGKSRS